jgi:regulator of cell morphogenesis and NO signaling
MPAPTEDSSVGILVTERASRAEVFDRFGIDYCCGGKLPIRWFCKTKGLDVDAVLRALDAADQAVEAAPLRDWARAPLAELIAHLVGTHHVYLRTTLPRLAALLATVADAHAAARPELADLAGVYDRFHREMVTHMDQEEQVVFPLIIRLERGLANRALGERFLSQQRGRMEAEHQGAGRDLDRMARLTQGFAPPDGACESHRALLLGLAEVLTDTHRHVSLENSLLFPRAAALISRPSSPRPGLY